MAAINQQEAAHFTDLEWLDNGIEFALKFFTKIAEIVLLIGVGYAGYKLAHHGPSNETLDQVWIVSQILALDLSAPGLFAMVKQARDSGQVERASWARRIAVILIVMSILSMVEGAVEYFLPGMSKDVITWASLLMMIARCGAAVGYSVFCRLQKAERATQLAIQPTQPTERIEELEATIEERFHTMEDNLGKLLESLQRVHIDAPAMDTAFMRTTIVEEIRANLPLLINSVNSENVTNGQVDALPVSSTEEVITLDGEVNIEERIRFLLLEDSSLSARAIAARVGCSPTTASKWKARIEKGMEPE